MRRIAQELDVWPMSLYRYFHDKQALLDALAQAAAEQIELPQARDDWAMQVGQLLSEVRRVLVNHPGGAELRLSGPDLPAAAARVGDSGRELLGKGGLELAEAETAWQALTDYVAGSARSPSEQFAYGLELLVDALRLRASSARMGQRPQ